MAFAALLVGTVCSLLVFGVAIAASGAGVWAGLGLSVASGIGVFAGLLSKAVVCRALSRRAAGRPEPVVLRILR